MRKASIFVTLFVIIVLFGCENAPPCSTSSDCIQGKVCYRFLQVCEVPCRSSQECLTGEVCLRTGECVPKAHAKEVHEQTNTKESRKTLEKKSELNKQEQKSYEKSDEKAIFKEKVVEPRDETKREYVTFEHFDFDTGEVDAGVGFKDFRLESDAGVQAPEQEKESIVREEAREVPEVDFPMLQQPSQGCSGCHHGAVMCSKKGLYRCYQKTPSCASWELVSSCGKNQVCLQGSCKSIYQCSKTNEYWPITLGGSRLDKVTSIAFDQEQNLYLSGYFSGELFLQGKNLQAKASVQGFVAKLSPTGKLLWVQMFETRSNGESRGGPIVLDASGSVFVAIELQGELTSPFSVSSQGKVDSLLVRLSKNGQVESFYQLGGPGNNRVLSLHFSKQGRLYLAGSYDDELSYKELSGSVLKVPKPVGKDGFVAKMDLQLKVLSWFSSFAGQGDQVVESVASTKHGEVWLTGSFTGKILFSNGATYVSKGEEDVFLAKLNAKGQTIFTKGFGSILKDAGHGIVVDAKQQVYVTGRFAKTVRMFPSLSIKATGGGDVFLLKLDHEGGPVWAKAIGPSSLDKKNSIVLHPRGDILVSGFFQSTMNLGRFSMSSKGGNDLFLLSFADSGDVLWGTSMDLDAFDFGSSLAVNGSGDVFVASSFYTKAKIGRSQLKTMGHQDSFVAKVQDGGRVYNFCEPSSIGKKPFLYPSEWEDETLGQDASVEQIPEEPIEEDPPLPSCDDCTLAGKLCRNNGVYVCTKRSAGCNVWTLQTACSGSQVCVKGNCLKAAICSQSREFWPFFLNGSSSEQIHDILVEPTTGAIYITGYIMGTAHIVGKAIKPKGGLHDLFIAKLAKDGSLLWFQSYKSNGNSEDKGWEMAFDKNGDLLVVISFTGEIHLNRKYQIHSGDDIVLAKISSNEGKVLWSKMFGGQSTDVAYSITLDSQKNIILAGQFRENIRIDGIQVNTKGGGSSDRQAFVIKMDPHGKVVWIKQFGGKGKEIAYKVRVDSKDHLWVVGRFQGQASFGKTLAKSAGEGDGFVLKLSPQGDVEKLFTISGKGRDIAYSLAIDKQDHVYVTGRFSKQTLFGSKKLLSSHGSGDTFVLKLDQEARLLWVRGYGRGALDASNDIVLDRKGNILFTGTLAGTLVGGTQKASGPLDLFVMKLDPQGKQLEFFSLNFEAFIFPSRLAVGTSDEIWLATSFYYPWNLGNYRFASTGSTDSFLTKLTSKGPSFRCLP